MAQEISGGNVVNKIQFRIDKKSWDNLALFQKKITSLKKQLGGLNSTIKVNAVVNKLDKVNKAVARSSIAAKKQEYNAHVAMYQQYRNKMEGRASFMERAVGSAQRGATNRFNPMGQGSVLSRPQQATFDSGFRRLTAEYAKHGDVQRFRSEVNHLTSSLLRQQRAAKQNATTFKSMRSDLIQATAAYTAFSAAANVFNVGKEFDSLSASMTLFAKNDAGVKETMSFLRSESERLGINFQEAATQYTKFAIVARNKMTQGETRELFTGISEYATVMQIDQYRFQRSMMAIQQIKGLPLQ